MDASKAQKNLLNAFEKILTPLVHVYLKFGGSYELFEEVARRVFIDVATERFKLADNRVRKRTRTKDISDSRISIITGMPRYSVIQTKKRMQNKEEIVVRYGRNAIVSGWMSDPEFLTDKGKPRILKEQKELGFSSLVEMCLPESDVVEAKDTLINLGVCTEEKNKLSLIRPENIDTTSIYFTLIQRWQSQSGFTDKWGRPKALPVRALPGFYDLCQKYKGDLPEKSVHKELLQLGCIEVLEKNHADEDDQIKLVTAGIIPKNSRPDQIYWGCENVANHMATVANNILNPVSFELIEKAVLVVDMPQEYLAQNHALANKEGFKLLQMLDVAFMKSDRETNPDLEGTGRYKAGCGVYYFQQEIQQEIAQADVL